MKNDNNFIMSAEHTPSLDPALQAWDNKDQVIDDIYNFGVLCFRSHKIKRSNKKRVEAVCKYKDCTFLRTYVCSSKKNWYLRKSVGHNCERVDSRISASFIKNKIFQEVNDIDVYKPRDAMTRVRSIIGVESGYHKSYRAIKAIKRDQDFFNNVSYGLIKPYLDWQNAKDERTITDYLENESNQFEYFFVCLSVAKNIFANSLPLIALDATHIKGRYKGVILSATGITGDDKIVNLAFGVGPIENRLYWSKFIEKLCLALDLHNVENLVILSDREKGIATAINTILPNAKHSFCVFHIEKNIKAKFKTDVDKLIWKAAKASNISAFNSAMLEIKNKNEAVFNYISQIPANNWARAYFPCARYGHVTSNIAESMNSWYNTIRNQVPFKILYTLIDKISDHMLKYKEIYFDMTPPISRTMQKILITKANKGRCLQVRTFSGSSEFYVQYDTGSSLSRSVNLTNKTCTCGWIQEFGYPCEHFYAVIYYNNLNEMDFIISQRKLSTLRLIYSGEIYQADPDILIAKSVKSPIQLRQPGRPSINNRIASLNETITNSLRQNKCGRCQENGHNKRTCNKN